MRKGKPRYVGSQRTINHLKSLFVPNVLCSAGNASSWTAMVATDRMDMAIPISFSPKPSPPSRTGVKANRGCKAVCAPPRSERIANENMMALMCGVNSALSDVSSLSRSSVPVTPSSDPVRVPSEDASDGDDFGGSVSSSHIAAMIATRRGSSAARKLGSRYGYVLKMGKVDVRVGKDLDEPNVPPMKDATRMPMLRHMGKNEKARDSFVESEISPLGISASGRRPRTISLEAGSGTHMTLFKTATFPFIIPFKLRVMTKVQKLLLKPKATAEIDDPMHPCVSVAALHTVRVRLTRIKTGFRPIRSESVPQWKTVRSCATEKTLSTTPAAYPTSSSDLAAPTSSSI